MLASDDRFLPGLKAVSNCKPWDNKNEGVTFQEEEIEMRLDKEPYFLSGE